MSPPQRRAYAEVRKDFQFGELRTKWATTRMVWLARIAGGFTPSVPPERLTDAKLDELVGLLTGELQHESVVVWFRFNAELAAAFHRLRRERISVAAILGATPPPIRHARRKRFQAGHVRVLLIQLKCGQYGLDCSRASTAIYYSNSYALEERLQSEARIEHASKHDALLYVDLVTRKTVNEAEVRTLRSKKLTASVFTARLIDNLIAVHQESV
jgi:superfamily II DNA or RNA helicase